MHTYITQTSYSFPVSHSDDNKACFVDQCGAAACCLMISECIQTTRSGAVCCVSRLPLLCLCSELAQQWLSQLDAPGWSVCASSCPADWSSRLSGLLMETVSPVPSPPPGLCVGQTDTTTPRRYTEANKRQTEFDANLNNRTLFIALNIIIHVIFHTFAIKSHNPEINPSLTKVMMFSFQRDVD